MEHIDEQVDKIFDVKQHIEYLKKDIINTRKRQLGFLSQLFELYKTKDREIDKMKMQFQMLHSEK